MSTQHETQHAQNMRDYCERAGITARVVTDHGVRTDESNGVKWEHRAFTVSLRNRSTRRTIQTQWKTGMLYDTEPQDDAASIFDSLILDAQIYENARDFEDFCLDFGYDTDSRSALALWNKLAALAPRVIRFVGGVGEYARICETVESL